MFKSSSYEQPSVYTLLVIVFLVSWGILLGQLSWLTYSLIYLLTNLVDCCVLVHSTDVGGRYSGAAQRTRLQRVFHRCVPQGFPQRQRERDTSRAGRCFTVLEQVTSSTDVLVSRLLA